MVLSPNPNRSAPVNRKIVITGGGTGGHVFPGIAIAEELQSRTFTILYVGSKTGIEMKLVPPTGIPLRTIPSGAIKNQELGQIFHSITKLLRGISASLSLLRSERPAAVVGVGGYVSVPICLASAILRIPIYLQEQNTTAGLANRLIGKLAKRIFLGFDQASGDFSARKCIVTGNPIRKIFFAPDFPPYNFETKTIFIFGGSHGAKAINEAVLQSLGSLFQLVPDLKLIHQTGEPDYERVKAAYPSRYRERVQIVPFVTEMDRCYATASLVISRSGALTVSELIQVGRPALLIPYPRKGKNDQTANAYYLQSQGVAKVVEQGGNNFPERFKDVLLALFNPALLSQMAEKFSPLRRPSAVVSIGSQIEKDLG